MTTPTELRSILISQESEYWLPYHYIARMPHDGFAQHFVDDWALNYISTIEFILRMVAQDNPSSLIDIGCGDGRFTREIHHKFPNIKVGGIDLSARAITLAKAMNQDATKIDFLQIDVTESRLSEPYESAVLMEVLEHIPTERVPYFLTGVRQTLKKNGILYLTVPHTNKAVEYKHFQHFTLKSISAHLAPYFDIVEITPFEKRGLSRQILQALLCNSFFVLNNRRLLNFLYNLYSKYLFFCPSESQCQRIYVKAIAK